MKTEITKEEKYRKALEEIAETELDEGDTVKDEPTFGARYYIAIARKALEDTVDKNKIIMTEPQNVYEALQQHEEFYPYCTPRRIFSDGTYEWTEVYEYGWTTITKFSEASLKSMEWCMEHISELSKIATIEIAP